MAHSTSQHSDEALARAAITDEQAFATLIRRYEKKLYFYIRRLTNTSHEEIEDILQEVFLRAYRYLNNFDASLSFSSWIYRIAHNQTISHYRKAKARPDTLVGEDADKHLETIAADFDLTLTIDTALEKKRIISALNKIDKKYRDVLILRYFEQKSYQEISDILKIPIKTVGTWMNRAKKQARKHI